jgi:excisionase family DNA binding protein
MERATQLIANFAPAILAAPANEHSALMALLGGLIVQLAAGMPAVPERVEQAGPERNLSADEAAARLGVSKGYAYRHAEELGGVRIGRRLVFPARALARVGRRP